VLFTEPRYLYFFLLVLGLHWALRGSARKVLLLLASYAFYACWDWRFLGLIWASTLLDFTVGLALSRPGTRRRAWLLASLVGNLGLLGFFKYFHFFVDSAVELLGVLGFQAHRPSLTVLLPVGISFYTFQTLSYSIDVYRGQFQARRNLLDFALFVAFFPQLVAGPIVRAREFLPQLDRPRRWRDVDVRAALVLFLVGFLKKACISDNVAPLVERFYAAPADFGALSAWIAALGYSAQVYCDFSGYSDMAIASAALLGYHLGVNFDRPYLSASLSEFWRRWHISLSFWLRDYLYIPLGGSHGGLAGTCRNLFLTLLISGLWHGAGWNFVLFGAIHGGGLVAQRLCRAAGLPALPRALGWPLTFAYVTLSFVAFRTPDAPTGAAALHSLFLGGSGAQSLDPRLLVVLAGLGIAHTLAAVPAIGGWWRRGPDWAFSLALAVLVALVLPFMAVDFAPFVYFQF